MDLDSLARCDPLQRSFDQLGWVKVINKKKARSAPYGEAGVITVEASQATSEGAAAPPSIPPSLPANSQG
eukprot:87015-Alexandrium_andersonii.AAC.1